MKKILLTIAIIIVLIGGFVWGYANFYAPVYQEEPIDIEGIITEITLTIDDPYAFFDGERVLIDPENPLIRPIIHEDRTMLPLRFIAESFGMEIEWNGETKTVKLSVKDTAILLTIGDPSAVAGGRDVELEVPALLLDDRTMIPLRFIAEEMNCEVDFNEDTREIRISFNDVPLTPEQLEARRLLIEDRNTAAMLSRAAAIMVTQDPLYYYDLLDFSTEVILDIQLIRPFLPNPDISLSVINTGTPPWIVSVKDGIYTVTDSSLERQVFFQGGWSTITPPPRPDGSITPTITETSVPTLTPTLTPTQTSTLTPTNQISTEH